MNLTRASAPWTVLVMSLLLILCNIRLSTQIRLRINPESLEYQRMKEKQWEMTHEKLTDDASPLVMAKASSEDVKPKESDTEYEPMKKIISKEPTEPAAENQVKAKDENGAKDMQLDKRDVLDSDSTGDLEQARKAKKDSGMMVEYLRRVAERNSGQQQFVNARPKLNFKKTASKIVFPSPANQTGANPEAADSIRSHVSHAISLQRRLMQLLRKNAKASAEDIVALKTTKDVNSQLISRLVKMMETTVITSSESIKLNSLLKSKVAQAINEINQLNENSSPSNATSAKDEKEMFHKRSEVLSALQQNEAASTAFNEVVSARSKLTNSLSAAHNATQSALQALKDDATLAQLDPRFNRIVLLGDHIKEAKSAANTAVKSAIEERAAAEDATQLAGLEPLSDIRSELQV